MKIGARTFKSGLSILIALIIPQLLNIPDATSLAGISAAASMQPSVKRSYQKFSQRIIASAIGGVVATIMAYYFGNNFFIIAVSGIILIALLHQFGLDDVINLSVITLVVIMLNDTDDILSSAIIRVIGTFIGVTVSFLVNQLVFPPKYDEDLFKKLALQTDEIAKLIRAALRKNSQYARVEHDLSLLAKNEKVTGTLFDFVREEATFSLIPSKKIKNRFFKNARTLVIYRQLIHTNSAGRELVEAFHNYENIYNNFPESLRILVRERLETLITAHEQIILKFNGRIPAKEVNFLRYKSTLRAEFVEAFFNVASSEELVGEDYYDDSNAVIHLMSCIFAYEEEINHLNTLIRSYRTKHSDYMEELDDNINLE